MRLAALLAVGGLGVAAVFAFPGPKPSPLSRLSTEKADLVQPSRPVAFASRKHDVIRTAMAFVRTAVTRRNVAASWNLVTPEMRQGQTKKQWASGRNLPVIEYPALYGIWRPVYSYADEVDVQVALFAHMKQKRPQVFDITLHPVRKGSRTRWLVSSFLPTPGGSGVGGLTKPTSLFGAPLPRTPGMGVKWLLAPLGIFALLPLVLLVLGVRRWHGARLYRAYARQD